MLNNKLKKIINTFGIYSLFPILLSSFLTVYYQGIEACAIPVEFETGEDSMGNVVRVWEEKLSSINRTIQASTLINSSSWSTQVQISNVGTTAFRPTLKVSSDTEGDTLALWLEVDPTTQYNFLWSAYTNTTTGSGVWDSPQMVSNGSEIVRLDSYEILFTSIGATGFAVALWYAIDPVSGNKTARSNTYTFVPGFEGTWGTPVTIGPEGF